MDGDEHPLVVKEPDQLDVGFGIPDRLAFVLRTCGDPGAIEGTVFDRSRFPLRHHRDTDRAVVAPPHDPITRRREGDGKDLVPMELEIAAMAPVGDVPEPHPAHVGRLGLLVLRVLYILVVVRAAELPGRGHEFPIRAEHDLIDLVANINLARHAGSRAIGSERQKDERPVGHTGSEQVSFRRQGEGVDLQGVRVPRQSLLPTIDEHGDFAVRPGEEPSAGDRVGERRIGGSALPQVGDGRGGIADPVGLEGAAEIAGGVPCGLLRPLLCLPLGRRDSALALLLFGAYFFFLDVLVSGDPPGPFLDREASEDNRR